LKVTRLYQVFPGFRTKKRVQSFSGAGPAKSPETGNENTSEKTAPKGEAAKALSLAASGVCPRSGWLLI
jgi:hypothetical protein